MKTALKLLKETLGDLKYFFSFNKSYSQCGEDLIINYIFQHVMSKKNIISYLDIGANHPIALSNTYYFYKKNKNQGRGLLIEPNPNLVKRLKQYRPNDTVLNVGISPNEHSCKMKFYLCEHHVLSTFSEDEKKQYEKMGHKFIGAQDIQTLNINNILNEYGYVKNGLDLLSLDVEGFDFEILKVFDFSLVRPKIIVAETVLHRSHLEQSKNSELIDFLISKNYFQYADTYINTVFVDRAYWEQIKE
jgi:FkbM family methyltransferase